MARIRLVCGANTQDAEGLVGKTIGQARDIYSDILNISPEAQAHVGGIGVSDEHVIVEGESFEFVKAAGRKA